MPRILVTSLLLLLLSFVIAAESHAGAVVKVMNSGNRSFTLSGEGFSDVRGINLVITYDNATLGSPNGVLGSALSGVIGGINPKYTTNALSMAVVSANSIANGEWLRITFQDGTGPGAILGVTGTVITPTGSPIPWTPIIINPVDLRDSDGDGVVDSKDTCPNTPKGVKVDSSGCPLVDSDNDGVYDVDDICPGTPTAAKGKVSPNGCPLDTDGDGIPDYLDSCANTQTGIAVDSKGCPVDANADGKVDLRDDDADGVPDYTDKCLGTPRNVAVDKNGCPPDNDGDRVPDYLDNCPGTPSGDKVDAKGCTIVDTSGSGMFQQGRAPSTDTPAPQIDTSAPRTYVTGGSVILPTETSVPSPTPAGAVPSQQLEPAPSGETTKDAIRTTSPEPGTAAPAASGAKKTVLHRGVSDRFRLYQGDRTPKELMALFIDDLVKGVRQEPTIAFADGKSRVKVIITPELGWTGIPTFMLTGAKMITLDSEEGGWTVNAEPPAKSGTVVLSIADNTSYTDIVLTVMPKVSVDLDKSGKVTESDFTLFLRERGDEKNPKGDLNGDGKRDYLDDYIFTGNYIAAAGVNLKEIAKERESAKAKGKEKKPADKPAEPKKKP